MKFKVLKLFLLVAIFITLIFFSCERRNNPPKQPVFLLGPSKGTINISYNFYSSSQDQDGDSIAIRFDWGDGDTSNWSSFVGSGDLVSMSHSWQDTGIYKVRAQAKDIKGAKSDWSAVYQIMITKAPLGWVRPFGGPDDDYGYSVQQTLDGGYIIVGYTSSFGAGGSDIYLVKIDTKGNQEWFKTFGGPAGDFGYSVQQTKDGGYIVVGETYSFGAGGSDVYLIKIDANGNQEWSKTFGGKGNDFGYSVQQTKDGGYIILGSTESFGAEQFDLYLIKIDANGNQEWYKTIGSFYNDFGYSVQQTKDGGYIIAGYTSFYGTNYYDDNIYLIKTDGKGNKQWSRIFGGSDWNYGYSVKETKDGGYIIVGYTSPYGTGGSDIYLIKTDENGNEEWSKKFGGAYDDRGYSVCQTEDGGYIIVGSTDSYGAGKRDIYLIKTDAKGNQEWYKTFGGLGDDIGRDLQQTKDGGYIIVGYTYSFGKGGSDIYLIKTDANGNVIGHKP